MASDTLPQFEPTRNVKVNTVSWAAKNGGTMRISFCLALLVAFGAACGSPAHAQRASSSSGTGFFVNQIGWLVTNAHVVKDCRDIEVVGHGKVDRRFVDNQNDIAAIHVTTTRLTSPLKLNPSPPRLGEEVIALGYPLVGILSSSVKMTMGNVSSLAPLGNESRYLQISAPLQPGNSGGPLMDMTGRVVGMNSMILASGKVGIDIQNVNFAIKSSVVRSFLSSHSIEHATQHEGTRRASVADVVEVGKRSTVLILCYGGDSGSPGTASSTLPGTEEHEPSPDNEQWFFAAYANVDFWGGDKYPKGLEADIPLGHIPIKGIPKGLLV